MLTEWQIELSLLYRLQRWWARCPSRWDWARAAKHGALVVSQLLTLFITPVFYMYMERFASGGEKRKAARPR